MSDVFSHLPSTRAEAKQLGSKHYFSGKPCKHGHIDKRIASNGACYECNLQRTKAHHKENPEYHRQKRVNKREWQSEYGKKWRAENKERVLQDVKRYRDAHPERVLANTNKRRAQRLNAIPKWETKEDRKAIKQIYEQAFWLTEATGIEFQVDHIYPLQGTDVCGLHTPSNLQIITAAENRQKSNIHPEESIQ